MSKSSIAACHWCYTTAATDLPALQWASIPVLALGVILVTLNNGAAAKPGAAAAATALAKQAAAKGGLWERFGYLVGMVSCSISGLSSAYAGRVKPAGRGRAASGSNRGAASWDWSQLFFCMPGLARCAAANSTLCGFHAGVYFERYVKGKHAASLWVRNIQLGIFGVPLSAAYMAVKDGSRILQGGLLQGFDASAWSVVALQVGLGCGGARVRERVRCNRMLSGCAARTVGMRSPWVCERAVTRQRLLHLSRCLAAW